MGQTLSGGYTDSITKARTGNPFMSALGGALDRTLGISQITAPADTPFQANLKTLIAPAIEASGKSITGQTLSHVAGTPGTGEPMGIDPNSFTGTDLIPVSQGGVSGAQYKQPGSDVLSISNPVAYKAVMDAALQRQQQQELQAKAAGMVANRGVYAGQQQAVQPQAVSQQLPALQQTGGLIPYQAQPLNMSRINPSSR